MNKVKSLILSTLRLTRIYQIMPTTLKTELQQRIVLQYIEGHDKKFQIHYQTEQIINQYLPKNWHYRSIFSFANKKLNNSSVSPDIDLSISILLRLQAINNQYLFMEKQSYVTETQTHISYKLNNGNDIPLIGFGTWKLDKDKCQQVVYNVIKMGYRHIDCAAVYANEVQVGKGIKRAIDQKIVQRKDLFITSKLWNPYHAPEHVKPAFLRSLNDLGLQYLDLYLMHYPIAIKYESPEIQYPKFWTDKGSKQVVEEQIPVAVTYKAMEQLVKDGLCKSIGVSNFNIVLLRDLWNGAEIKPAVLQNELHPYLTCKVLAKFCNQKNICLTSYSTLGGTSYVQMGLADQKDKIANNEKLQQMAKIKGKSVTQLVFRWAIQQGIAIIPKSTNPLHMQENRQLLGWKLSQEQMKQIDGLNRDHRYLDVMTLVEKYYGYFYPIWQ